MYLHEVKAALEAGKKIKRLSWAEKSFLLLAKSISTFELDDDECKAIGVPKQTIAEPAETCLLLVEDAKVSIGYELTSDDKTYQDWEVA